MSEIEKSPSLIGRSVPLPFGPQRFPSVILLELYKKIIKNFGISPLHFIYFLYQNKYFVLLVHISKLGEFFYFRLVKK